MTREPRTPSPSIPFRRFEILKVTIVLVLGGLLGTALVAAETDGQLLIPPDDLPAALEGLGLDIARGFAMSPDGQRAATGVPDPHKPRGGYVRFTTEDGAAPAEVSIKGQVLQLCFDPSLPFIYVLGQRVGRKGVLDAFVSRIDTSTLSVERIVTLPASASELSVWIHRPALLVATENEIRSILLPVGRSGPLYQVPGKNLAVASLPGSDRIVVGQDLQILLIDLSDTQGPDAMPVREKLDVPTPVARILPSPRGDAALVRLDDGRVYTLRLDPMRLEDERSADWIAWMGGPVAYEPAPPVTVAPTAIEMPEPVETETASPPAAPEAEVVEKTAAAPDPTPEIVESTTAAPEPESRGVEKTVAAGAAAVAVVEAAEPPEEEPSPVAEPPAPEPAPVEVEEAVPEEATLEPEREATVDIPTSAPPEPPPAVPVPETTPATPPAAPSPAEPETGKTAVSADPSKGDAEGKLTGPALSEVVAVVLHGPNNIMREAARVRPERDGTWSAFGLEPGRYRVLLDGGGGRVLQSQPSFRTVDVKAGSRVTVEAIHVSGTL